MPVKNTGKWAPTALCWTIFGENDMSWFLDWQICKGLNMEIALSLMYTEADAKLSPSQRADVFLRWKSLMCIWGNDTEQLLYMGIFAEPGCQRRTISDGLTLTSSPAVSVIICLWYLESFFPSPLYLESCVLISFICSRDKWSLPRLGAIWCFFSQMIWNLRGFHFILTNLWGKAPWRWRLFSFLSFLFLASSTYSAWVMGTW